MELMNLEEIIRERIDQDADVYFGIIQIAHLEFPVIEFNFYPDGEDEFFVHYKVEGNQLVQIEFSVPERLRDRPWPDV